MAVKMNFSLQELNPTRIGIPGVILFVFGFVFGEFAFPRILHGQVASQLALKPGSDTRKIWSKIPDPLTFKIYIFNVTNPMDVQGGGVPVLTEIGPYVYEEFKEKINLTDHDKDDAVSFNPQDTWFFNGKKSEELTGDELLTVPHPALVAMALTIERELPAALKILNKAIPIIFAKPTSMFITTTARNILFDGVPIYCNVTDFSSKAVCAEIKKRKDRFQQLEENIYGFSFFGLRNATAGSRFRVKRGIKNIKELGQVVQFKGENALTIWSGDKCNNLTGTDSTIFPPFLTPQDPVAAFTPEICRSVAAYYTRNTKYKGYEAYTYNADFGDMSQDPDLECFCTTPDTCLRKGVHDLTNCVGAPFIASLPHFYLADKQYQRGVIGLNPMKEKHEIISIFDPMTSTPLYAHRRLQLSIALHKIDTIDLMQEAPTIILPILWIDEGFELNQKLLSKVHVIYKAILAMNVLKWILIVMGVCLGGTSLWIVKKRTDMQSLDLPGIPKTVREVTPLDNAARY